MERALRQTVVIGPRGRIEVPSSELAPGSTAEITVLPLREAVSEAKPPADREALVRRMRELSDKAIAEGMETWTVDQVNEEVRRRRYGDREEC